MTKRRVVLPFALLILVTQLVACSPQEPAHEAAASSPTSHTPRPSVTSSASHGSGRPSESAAEPTSAPDRSSSPTSGDAGLADATNACRLLDKQFHASGASAEETLSLSKSGETAAVSAADAAISANNRWEKLSSKVKLASGSFTSYLEANDPNVLKQLESAATGAADECKSLGVTVRLEQ